MPKQVKYPRLEAHLRKGARYQTFRNFAHQLQGLGHTVDWQEIHACNYAAPSIRKRFFSRREGLTLNWPKATHGAPTSKKIKAGKLLPWCTGPEYIDWSIPCPSIFERKELLADATLRRMGKRAMRYMVKSDDPFIVDDLPVIVAAPQPPSSPALKEERRLMTNAQARDLVIASSDTFDKTAPIVEFGTRIIPSAEPAHGITAQQGGGT